MLGPFAKGQAEALGIFQEAEAMRAGVPWAGVEVVLQDQEGKSFHWKRPDLEPDLLAAEAAAWNPRPRLQLDSGRIELNRYLPSDMTDAYGRIRGSGILYLPIHAEQASLHKVTIGGFGTFQLWWNGERLLEDRIASTYGHPDWFRLELPVEAGVNHLMVQVEANNSGWSFEMQSYRPVSEERVKRAIDAGVQYLLDRQAIDGSWPDHFEPSFETETLTAGPNYSDFGEGNFYPAVLFPNRGTAAALYALLSCGLDPQHEAIIKGLASLRSRSATHADDLAMEILAFLAAGDQADHPRVAENAARILEMQKDHGSWWGPQSGKPQMLQSRRILPVVLSLRAVADLGFPMPSESWKRLAEYGASSTDLKRLPRNTYQVTSSGQFIAGWHEAYPAAGLVTLRICREQIGQDWEAERLAELVKAEQRCLEFLLSTVQENGFFCTPLHAPWLYDLTVARQLLQLETLKGHDLYGETLARMVREQNPSGGWYDEACPTREAYALLTLAQPKEIRVITDPADSGAPGMLSSGPLQLWFTPNPQPSLWIDKTTDGFERIQRVVYWLQDPAGNWQRVMEEGAERFAILADLPSPGLWHFRADAFLDDGTTLASGMLQFKREAVATPERLAYAHESAASLAADALPRPKASSERRDYPIELLVDGGLGTSWYSAPDDHAPEVEVRFMKPQKTSVLKLVLAPVLADSPQRTPRITRLEVQVNKREPMVLELSGDLGAKVEIPFAKPMKVSRLKVRVLAVDEGVPGEDLSVGLAEVELYGPR